MSIINANLDEILSDSRDEAEPLKLVDRLMDQMQAINRAILALLVSNFLLIVLVIYFA